MRQAICCDGYGGSPRSAIGRALGHVLKAALLGTTLVLAGAAQGNTANTMPEPSEPLKPRAGDARPVTAWVQFCHRLPAECTVDASEPTVVAMTPEIWQSLVAVNRRVNERIRPITDKAHFGVIDRWDYPDDGMGDCEDYQLLKRRLLAERGLPRRAMRMTVVIDEENQGHAVLTVLTDRGDFILDNKTNLVLPWEQTGYLYVKREGQDGRAWVSLGGVTSPTATANK